MAHLLGLTPPKSDGNLNILAGTLRDGGGEPAKPDAPSRESKKAYGAGATMSAVVLGIDGGGTRTRASIVNGEQVLAFAENGSIKRLRVGAQAAEENSAFVAGRGLRPGRCHRGACSVGGRGQFHHARCPGVDHRRVSTTSRGALGDRRRRGNCSRRGLPRRPRHSPDRRHRHQLHRPRSDGGRETAGGWSSRLGDEGSGLLDRPACRPPRPESLRPRRSRPGFSTSLAVPGERPPWTSW